MAKLYLTGSGVEQNLELAGQYFSKAVMKVILRDARPLVGFTYEAWVLSRVMIWRGNISSKPAMMIIWLGATT